jgi:hypothetical protein
MIPERRLLLRPQTQQPVVRRHRLHAVPEQRAELLGQGKVAKRLAVDAALALGDLQPKRAQHRAIRALGHLEFGDAPGQVGSRVKHGFP